MVSIAPHCGRFFSTVCVCVYLHMFYVSFALFCSPCLADLRNRTRIMNRDRKSEKKFAMNKMLTVVNVHTKYINRANAHQIEWLIFDLIFHSFFAFPSFFLSFICAFIFLCDPKKCYHYLSQQLIFWNINLKWNRWRKYLFVSKCFKKNQTAV